MSNFFESCSYSQASFLLSPEDSSVFYLFKRRSTGSKNHQVWPKSGDVYATEIQGPGCFATIKQFESILGKIHTLASWRIQFENGLLKITRVCFNILQKIFLETTVKIVMHSLTWKNKKLQTIGPRRSTASTCILSCNWRNETHPDTSPTKLPVPVQIGTQTRGSILGTSVFSP